MHYEKILSPRYFRFGVIGVVLQAAIKLFFKPVAGLHIKCLIACIFVQLRVYRGQTSEAFFVIFSRILFSVKWKHGQGCIK